MHSQCILVYSSNRKKYHPIWENTRNLHFHTLENEGALQTYEERIFNILKDSIKLGANEIDPLMNGVRTKLKRYNWQHVDKFVVIVVTTEDFLINPLVTPAAMTLSLPKPNLSPVSCVYHRLDLLPSQLQSKLCRHFQVCFVQFLFNGKLLSRLI